MALEHKFCVSFTLVAFSVNKLIAFERNFDTCGFKKEASYL